MFFSLVKWGFLQERGEGCISHILNLWRYCNYRLQQLILIFKEKKNEEVSNDLCSSSNDFGS